MTWSLFPSWRLQAHGGDGSWLNVLALILFVSRVKPAVLVDSPSGSGLWASALPPERRGSWSAAHSGERSVRVTGKGKNVTWQFQDFQGEITERVGEMPPRPPEQAGCGAKPGAEKALERIHGDPGSQNVPGREALNLEHH